MFRAVAPAEANIFTYGDARGWSFDYYMGRAYELFINSTLHDS